MLERPGSRFVLLTAVAILIHIFGPFTERGQAQVVPLQNADLQPDGPIVHSNVAELPGWEISEGHQNNVRTWNAPDSPAIALGAQASISQEVDISNALDADKQGRWRAILAIDIIGKFGSDTAASQLVGSISDSTGRLLVRKEFTVENDAPVSTIVRPRVLASSHRQGSGIPEHAFDGDRSTIWHSDWGQHEPVHPHFLALDFGETRILNGLKYAPRLDGGNGTIKKFELEVSADGTDWKTAFAGEFKYSESSEIQTVVLDEPVRCRMLRLKSLSSKRGDKFASCSELIPDVEGGFTGLTSSAVESSATVQRCFVPLTFDQSEKQKKIRVEINVESKRYVVVDNVHLIMVPEFATMKMRGKANGVLGPDLLGAGSYGFQGLMVHHLPVLPVIEVTAESPAAKAGLRKTDLIVGVNDRFLPAGNVDPGFAWFQNSHEALLGRAAANAYESKTQQREKGRVKLNVLRGDELVDLNLKLRLPHQIGRDDFLVNPDSLSKLNEDLIAQVVKTQSANGSWKNNPIHTCLGGLALLSTHDQKHAASIKAAANFLMESQAEPGNGFYWHPAFAGIFLCEYYLATGDERTLPVVERMLGMMGSAFHTSKWGTETFGHGPKGLPYGNKSLVAVMVHVMLFEELAKRCGLESKIYERLVPYLESAWSDPADGGHGALGYNASYKDLNEFWSRSGILSLALHLKNARPDMQTAMTQVMYERHPWFRNSHAYGEPGGLLGLLGLAQVNPQYYQETISRYRWWFALAWQPGDGLSFTIPHMGAPYMEGPILINNGYAIVTNLHKKTLQITGGKKTDWLNVSSIPVPVSDVLILQDRSGEVSLRCKIPGSEIYYTRDGTTPTRRSTQYKAPFSVTTGQVVQAVAISKGETSKVAARGFGFDKSNWKVVSCNGHKDPEVARQFAAHAFDGDKRICWVPDVGEAARQYPYEVVVDMGESQTVQLAGISYISENGAASKITVQASNEADSGFQQIGTISSSSYAADVRIELTTDNKVRFLRFVFDAPFKQESPLLMLGEIDIR